VPTTVNTLSFFILLWIGTLMTQIMQIYTD